MGSLKLCFLDRIRMEAAKSVTSTEVASNASETVALSGKIVTSRRKGRLFFVVTRTQNNFLLVKPGRRHRFFFFFFGGECVFNVLFIFEGFETILGVSKNNGTPKSSILIGFINHLSKGTSIFLVYSGKTATIIKMPRIQVSLCELWEVDEFWQNHLGASRMVPWLPKDLKGGRVR